jgi:hypothetical protein
VTGPVEQDRIRASGILCVLALLTTSVTASPAAAQPAAVEDLIRKGNDLRTKGEDQWALPLFQKAYDLERSPRTAAQLGLVEAALGYWLSSERHLQEALTSTRNPWLIRFETQIRKTLAHVQASIGEVAVTGSPQGAEIIVNGQPAGKLPLTQPVRVGEGAVQVTLRAPGYKEASSQSKVAGGQRVTVAIALEALPNPLPAPPSPIAKAHPSDAAEPRPPAAALAAQRKVDESGSATWVRPAAWVAAAAAAAALSVGGYGLYTQRKRGEQFDNYPAGSPVKACGASRADKGGGTCKTLYDQAQAGKRLMIGGFAAGGVLATAAIVGFAMSASGGEAGESVVQEISNGPSLMASQTSIELGWSVRF